MPARIRTRLSLSFLVVLLIGMGLAAALAWFTVEKLYLDTQRENLLAQARLTAQAIRGEDLSGLADTSYTQTSNALPGIHTHVLEGQDAVLLPVPPQAVTTSRWVPAVENRTSISTEALYQRSEIDLALHGTPATAVRRVASAGNRRILYAAATVYSATGQVDGIVYLAMPLPSSGLPGVVILRLTGVLLLALLLALLAAALISRRMARPLEAVARAADLVTDGDLGRQVPADHSIRELESLGRSFNAMTASLQQADQAKTAFLADVTHELRTPLTVIKGTIETLEDGALDDAEGRGPLLASMQRETERLIRLVNDLLVLTRVDAGALKLSFQSVDLGELARLRCQALTPIAMDREVRIGVDVDGSALALGDPDRLAQVLDNLLDNAIRHSPPASTIAVSLQQQGSVIRCSVSDQGSGIPPAHLPFIFERFYRVEASRDRQTGGSGLGLAIVRSLVTAHHGRVSAESLEGQGTTINFWLPAAS